MKKTFAVVLVGLAMASARADTPLSIGTISPGPGGPCYDDTDLIASPPRATGAFTLPTVAGTGSVTSSVAQVADNIHHLSHLRYDYSVDMTGISPAANHCVRVLVHFGTPHGCTYDVLQFTGPGSTVSSASKAPYGDVTFLFNSGCLVSGQKTVVFSMLTDVQPKTNVVTIIDDYTDPASGSNIEARINVTAVVPDIPPDWVYAPMPLPRMFFQGFVDVGTNQTVTNVPPLSGPYEFTAQLVDAASNGLPVGPVVTQTVQVVRGLFNMPLPFEPGALGGGTRWLSIGVRPGGSGDAFSILGNLAITPAPQAFYAYSAGVVADISQDQAVLTMNGISGNMTLVPGPGIQIFADGSTRTLTITTSGQPSDRNIKTDFSAVQPDEILNKLLRLPIQNWRFTNEVATIRHLGPMAQDFKAAFGLGEGNTTIGTVDESGVALSAIQGLDRKLEDQLKAKDAEIEALKSRLNKLEKSVEQQNVNH